MPKGFQKGIVTNPKGRGSGTLNRTTKEAKELLEKILLGQVNNIEAAFEALKKDPVRYIDACAKMFSYVIPKKTDVTSDGKEILSQTLSAMSTAELKERYLYVTTIQKNEADKDNNT